MINSFKIVFKFKIRKNFHNKRVQCSKQWQTPNGKCAVPYYLIDLSIKYIFAMKREQNTQHNIHVVFSSRKIWKSIQNLKLIYTINAFY